MNKCVVRGLVACALVAVCCMAGCKNAEQPAVSESTLPSLPPEATTTTETYPEGTFAESHVAYTESTIIGEWISEDGTEIYAFDEGGSGMRCKNDTYMLFTWTDNGTQLDIRGEDGETIFVKTYVIDESGLWLTNDDGTKVLYKKN